MKKHAAVVILFAVTFLLNGAATAGEVQKLIRQGDAAYKTYDNKGALALYEKGAKADPENFEAASKRTRTLIDTGEDIGRDDSPEAMKIYEQAVAQAGALVKKWPKESQAHYYLALANGKLAQSRGGKEKVKLSRGIYNEATEAVKLDPKAFRPYLLLGVYHRNVATLSWVLKAFANSFFGGLPPGSLPESRQNLEKAIELEPEYVRSHYELALTLEAMGGQEGKMVSHLEKVMGLKETDHLDKRYKAEAKELLGRYR